VGKDCDYERELSRLQVELVKLQEWIRHEGLRVVVLFEGRDAAGKGGAIKRITESLNPRVCRVVALGTPTEREKRNGTSSAMCRICPRPARWCSSTAVGITAPAWSG
jgi:polyphosphate kinase 2 (PPK2 family)